MKDLNEFKAGRIYELMTDVENPLAVRDRRRTGLNWMQRASVPAGMRFICTFSDYHDGHLALVPEDQQRTQAELPLFEGRNHDRRQLLKAVVENLEPVDMDARNMLLGAQVAYGVDGHELLLHLIESGDLRYPDLEYAIKHFAAKAQSRRDVINKAILNGEKA